MHRLQHRPARWVIIAIICGIVAPLVGMTTYMSAFWDPSPHLRDVQLAVVNADAGATQAGKPVSYGADIATALVDTDYLNFTLTDATTADAGLHNGDYMFVISIPENFSRDILSVLGTHPVQPEVLLSYNDYYGSNSPVITKALVPEIENKISAGITESYAKKLLTGLDTLGTGLADAADGAARLDAGMAQLAAGLDKGAAGTDKLAAGAGELAAGTTTLEDGAAQLASGATQLATGMDTLVAGTGRLGEGATQIDTGVRQLTDLIQPLLAQASDISTVLYPVADTLEAFGDAQGARTIRDLIASVDQTNPASMSAKLQALTDGTSQLAYNLSDPASPYLSGMLRLHEGAGRLAAGTGQLATGATRLDDGAHQLAAGTTQLQDGTTQLQTGATKLAAGTGELAAGLQQGADRAPSIGNLEHASNQVAIPVVYNTDYHNAVQTQISEDDPTTKTLSSGAALLFLLVFGYLLMALVAMLAPHIVGRRRYTKAYQQVLSGFAIAGGINLILVSILAYLGHLVGWEYHNPAAMGGVLLLIATSTTAIYQMFRVCFRRVLGGILALGFFAYGLFSFGGVWPVQTIPAPLRLVHEIHPMSYARTLFVFGSTGDYGARFWVSLLVLFVVTVASLTISVIVRRKRLQAASRQPIAQAAAKRSYALVASIN